MPHEFEYTYPELSEYGQKTTQNIINRFAKQMSEVMNKSVVEFTQNLAAEITNDDSWINVRQQTLEALCGYSEAERVNKEGGTYLGQWWVTIRKKILEENREAITTDILKDKDNEIYALTHQINQLRQDAANRF